MILRFLTHCDFVSYIVSGFFFFLVAVQVFVDYTSMTEPRLLESLMKEVTEEIRKLWDTLMGLEMELVDQLEVLDSNSMSFFRCKIPN